MVERTSSANALQSGRWSLQRQLSGMPGECVLPPPFSAIRRRSKIVGNAAAENVEIGDMNKTREFLLPFGIDLRVEDGIASIESDFAGSAR